MPARRVLVVALVLASACAKKSKPDSATPASDSTMPQSIDELEVELGRYEAELRTMGFAGDKQRNTPLEGTTEEAPADAGAASEAGKEESSTRICDLAAAICGLQDRICALATEHAGDERYTASCERATEDCDDATEACNAAVG